MSSIIMINPGTWGTEGSEEEALKNLSKLVEDAGIQADVITIERYEKADYNGRFGFNLFNSQTAGKCEVSMPGLPLEQVRFMGEEGQNIWFFPACMSMAVRGCGCTPKVRFVGH